MSDALRGAVEEALKSAEVARRAGDKVEAVTYSPDGTVALTASGRLFLRAPDPNHYNDGRTVKKYRWTEIDGPLAP